MTELYDAAIVGGGFFGCRIALSLRQQMERVVVLEQAPDLLTRASYNNQARVHNGYHYPRSILTALRSRVNFDKFAAEFGDCIESDFTKIYAIGRRYSKLSAAQFKLFCQRIGAELNKAPPSVERLFNPDTVEAVFATKEYAFDAVKLRNKLTQLLEQNGVELRTSTRACAIREAEGRLKLTLSTPSGETSLLAKHVYNCTYSNLNSLLVASNLPLIPLKHEFTELSLVEVPKELDRLAITVMDGPFFSLMPFPPRGYSTLSHVRYTPHFSFRDEEPSTRLDPDSCLRDALRKSNFDHMVRDSLRYVPALRDSRYVDSLWEVKSVLPASEVDDSRPILFRPHHGLPNLTCILGGKIDNVYDVLDEIEVHRSAPLLGEKAPGEGP